MNNYPSETPERQAFEKYMNAGGAFIGFHVCAAYFGSHSDAGRWNWYFDEFLGCGNFASNTWNPTVETLLVETHDHFSTANLPDTIESCHNEWYNWEYDLRENEDITVLMSLDASTFPVGDRVGEIWQSYVYCPVVWTNNNYKMMYINMGHNLQNYNDFDKISSTFESEEQNQFMRDAILGIIAD